MDTQTPDLQAVVERQCRELAERLEKVEGQSRALANQNRWLKVAGAVTLVLVAALVLVGATTPKSTDHSTSDFKFRSVEARELIVVDERGTIRAKLRVRDAGPSLHMFDEKGKTRVKLDVEKAVAGLGLFDEKGTSRAGLIVGEDGPVLGMADEKGTTRAALIVGEDGSELDLADAKGTTRVVLGVDKDGPSLGLYDEKLKKLWSAP